MKEKTNRVSTENNCLDLVRIIAAFQVMFGHMVEHLELPINDMLFHVTFFLRGVPIFFVISGFLIWFSIGRSKTYSNYLKKRFWRIYPELWCAVIVETTILLIVYRGWNIKDTALFVIGQASIFQFWTPDTLRGYGVGTPNGALWTIGVMIQFYIIAWFFYKLMKNRRIGTWIMGLVFSFCISWLLQFFTHDIIEIDLVGKLYDQTFVKYFWLFYTGMLIAEFKDILLPFFRKYWYAFLVVAFFSS